MSRLYLTWNDPIAISDISTLFTNMTYDKLKNVMRELISFCFKDGENSLFLQQNLVQHKLKIKQNLRKHLMKLP